MTRHEAYFMPGGSDQSRDITKLVVMAVGGQGGGVLTNWIEAVCRAEGRAVQSTSVAGVAQRTGATIYYIEIAPQGIEAPIFSLAPSAGDVDILIAAELMEAGRAIQRGFVTPDRTTLIASNHRAFSVSEKMVPGNGIASADEVLAATEIAAQTALIADMEKLAVDQGSVISASLLGALAGSGALPFDRSCYETAIRKSGKGVDASLAAFEAGFGAVTEPPKDQKVAITETSASSAQTPKHHSAEWAALQARLEALPEAIHEIARAGLLKVVDFQDLAYGADYLSRLEDIARTDDQSHGFAFTHEAAKYLANAMAYDDVIRVADRKTRGGRFNRIDGEMGKSEDQVMKLTEYFHPRAEELAGLLPARMGKRLEASPKWMGRLDRWFCKGRRIRTDRLRGFLMLYAVAALRGYRRRTHRHAIETEHLEIWLGTARKYCDADYQLGVEVLQCRRLIKGYSDTHARGLSKFDRVMESATLVAGRDDAADWVRRLREAALKDEKGDELDGALKTVRSFIEDSPAPRKAVVSS